MAGSFVPQSPDDSTLTARLEALALVAQHIEEPVVVLTPSLQVVYANNSALKIKGVCPLLEEGAERDPRLQYTSPTSCDVCPVDSMLDGSVSVSQLQDETEDIDIPNCPFSRAMALYGNQSHIGSVVLMGKNGFETVVHSRSIHGGPSDREALDRFPLIGSSSAMAGVVELMKVVAPSEAPVLLQGESGTGKELAARTIHSLSGRKTGPFVAVDCGALTETLLESELFGHVRGAFTGAVSTRKGLFEEAQGGTIFLDEISNTSPAFQAKLLRVIQEAEVKPVGSNQSIHVDVRIISATNTLLEQLVKAKVFRPDLFYRLAVLPITIPPLRDRIDDIPLLIDHFVRKSCERNGRMPIHVLPEVPQELMSRCWPGNVRELEHTIERAVLLSRDGQLTRFDVRSPQEMSDPSQDLASVGKGARVQVERVRILEALRESKGNRTKAAKLLHISRASLYNKLREYHIS